MSEIRKAAVLLLSLDKPLAAAVLGQMRTDLVEQVTLQIAKLKDVTKEEQESVVKEFYDLVSARSHIERGGFEFASELLRQSLGDDRAGLILEHVKHSMSAVPFGFLKTVGADNLLTFIVEEHPQTIALVMSHLPPSISAELLAGLPFNKQTEVVRRIANMEQTSPDVVHDVEKGLERRMASTFNQQLEKAGGIPMAAQILNVTDRMTNKGILENLEEEDLEIFEEIRRLMFVFDDLLKLDNKAIQALLKEVDNKQWAVALKGAAEEIRDKVLGNLSQRAADMLREEMDYLGPVKVSDVEAIQQQIVDAVRRLEDAGEIEIDATSDADHYIS